jgi:hypothetical protein
VLACAAGALSAIWLWWIIDTEASNDESIARAAGISALYAVATSHGSLLLRRIAERPPAGQLVRYGTFGCGIVIATILTAVIAQGDGDVGDPQFLAVLAILYVLGTVVSPLLRLTEPKGSPAGTDVNG